MNKILLKLGVALPLLSIFLWAAFDIKWWGAFGIPYDSREAVLGMLHIFVPLFCGFGLMDHGEE